MKLSGRQKKFLKKHRSRLSVPELARQLGTSESEVSAYLGLSVKGGVPAQEADSPGRKKEKIKPWMYLLFFFILIFLIYAVTLPYAFISDDFQYLVNNPRIADFRFVTDIPLTSAKAFLDFLIYHAFGLNPAFFRFKNILFHTGSVFMLFLIVRKLKDSLTAFFAAVLFAVHPIVTESVTWIGGGGYPQYAFFFLASFYVYITGRTARSTALSVALFLIMLLTSEKSVSLSLAFPLYEVSQGRFGRYWKRTLPFLSLSVFWGFFILYGLGYLSQRIQILESSYYNEAAGYYNPLLQVPTAVATYLKLLLFPANLSFYQSELSTSPFGFAVRVAVLAGYVALMAFAYFRNRFAFFFMSLFFVSLMPMLTPLKIGWIVAERYVYLGSAAVITAFSLIPAALARNPRFRLAVYILFAGIVLALATRTMVRNSDWQNQDTLWIATGKTAPTDPKTHNNLGDLYGRSGDLKKSREEFELAIRLNPNYADAYHNLGNVLVELGEIEKAEEAYLNALRYNPGLWQTHQALSVISYRKERWNDSVEHLRKALAINPGNPDLWANLGIVYFKAGNREESESAFDKALSLDPANRDILEVMKNLK